MASEVVARSVVRPAPPPPHDPAGVLTPGDEVVRPPGAMPSSGTSA